VRDQDPELLRYLEKSGIIPGVKLTVLEKAPFDGPVKIMLEDKETTIGNSVAKDVFLVERD
ncbi:MAG TPA: DtxR family transcriptional regulator, partial [Balneola sp.]|nr:DtxR family transcriptional regulator [Balneola sp.]